MILSETLFTDKVNYLSFWPDEPEPFTILAEETYDAQEINQD